MRVLDLESIKIKLAGIVKQIVAEYDPEKIILFGSFAWGKPTEYSDFDLLVIKNSDKSNFEMVRDIYRIIFKKGEAVDILVYTPEQLERRKKLNDPFVLDIINNGKLLYARK
ncbi:MAG: nucleotidyltransferase domain-containing protein [Patescibacteria group bacterium]